MSAVNIHEAKTRLSALVAEVETKGTWFQICRNGKPVAELRPIRRAHHPLRTNPKLRARFHEDPMLPLEKADWPDAPLA